jgi:hypothetical protein
VGPFVVFFILTNLWSTCYRQIIFFNGKGGHNLVNMGCIYPAEEHDANGLHQNLVLDRGMLLSAPYLFHMGSHPVPVMEVIYGKKVIQQDTHRS